MNQKIDQRVRITFRQLEVFAATARSGTMRAGANRVSRSQSAASAALAELEATLEVQLFDRVARRLVLNENGRALLPRAIAVLDDAANLESLFRQEHATRLSVASSFTIGEYLLPQLISDWQAAHAGCRAQLSICNTHDVLTAVASFAADLGFIEGTTTHADLVIRPWSTDELLIVAAVNHPLAGRDVNASELAQAAWVLREAGSGTREASDRWLTTELDRVVVELELGSNEAVKRAVASGLGLGCLSRVATHEAIANGSLVELRTCLPKMKRTLFSVTHGGKRMGATAQSFLKHCYQHA